MEILYFVPASMELILKLLTIVVQRLGLLRPGGTVALFIHSVKKLETKKDTTT